MTEVPNKIESPVVEVTSELRHTGSKIGLFGNTPAERPAPIVQTYSSKTRTHSNPTGAALTDNTGESPDTTVEALSIRSSKFWGFESPAGSSGVFYFGNFYKFHSSAFTPAGGTSVGTANSSYAAHAIVVLGAASTDMVVRVTGTSINDSGTRTPADFEDVDTSGGSTNDYFETAKKFLGQVSYTLQSGTGVTINAGFAKYWDFGNTDFDVIGCEATWLGGANDSGADVELLHHKATGWTYGAGGTPTTPTPLGSMATDHGTESNVVNSENGSWKRTNLSQTVLGSASEGILFRITTSANKAFQQGTFQLDIESGGEANRNFSDLADQHNKIVADLANAKQVLNQILCDLKLPGMLE